MQKVATKQVLLITGATGQQGGAVANELLIRGIPFRALSRSPHKLKHLHDQGIETVQGTMEDRKTLKEALNGIKLAYLVTTPYEEGIEAEIQYGINFIDMAAECGVEHLVFSSVAGAERNTGIPHFESKEKIERHLKSAGIPYTIFRPVFFMENFGSPWFLPDLKKGKLSLPVHKDIILQMISVDVIGAFVVEALHHPTEYLGAEIEIASDQLTFPKAIKKIAVTSGKTCTYEEMPIQQAEKQYGADFAKMFQWFNEKGFAADLDALQKKGIHLTTFDEYLAQAQWVKQL